MAEAGGGRGYRLGVLALLLVATVINSFDRASLAVAAPYIRRDFGISASTMGVALSAFFWTYIVGNFLGGRLADLYGTKRVLGAAFGLWSLCSAATGLAGNIVHVVAARLGVGFAEGPSFPTTTKIFASNFPTEERGTAIGINSAGARVGLSLCPIVMAALIVTWGWRAAFFVTGLSSLAWLLFWWRLFTDRAEAARPPARETLPWSRLLSSPAVLALVAVKFSQDYLQWLFLTWIPSYLVTGRHFSAIEMGFYTSLAFGFAFVAQPGVGFLSDWLIRRGWGVNRARKTVQVVLQLLSATVVMVELSDNVAIALAFMVLAISAESICAGHIWTIIADVIPARHIGGVGGIVNAIGAIAGILSPIVTGALFDATGSFEIAFALGSLVMLVAAGFTLFAVPSLDRPWTHLFESEAR